MKKTSYFFILLIGILLVIAPYIEGYLFRNNYYQVFAWYQQEILNRNNGMEIKIDSYDLGWMQSTVNLSITSKEKSTPGMYNRLPMVLRIKSIIHHGPLVYINNKWQLGSAGIETSFYLPDMLKAIIHESEHGFMQMNTYVSLDGNYATQVSFDSMQLPPSFPVSNVTKFNFSASVKNLNVERTHHFESPDALLTILTPTSSANMSFSMVTELGAASGQQFLSLTSLPNTNNDIVNNLNVELNTHAAQPLIEKILTNYLVKRMENVNRLQALQSSITSQPVEDQIQHAKMIINSLLQQGYIAQHGNEYIVSLSKKGQEINLNGKAMTENDFEAIWLNINQTINNTIAPIIPTVVPTTSMTMPAPTSNTNGYNCYWMENQSGKYQWVIYPGPSKSQCFALDSCNGGLKQSNGGCYKWASSPNGKPEPWNQPVNSAVQH